MKNLNSFNYKWPILLLVLAFSGCKINNKSTNNQQFIVKVMSYNIHHGNPPGYENKIDLKAIVETIKNADADIVALQEVDVNTKRSGNINEAEILAKELGMFLFFSKAIDFDGGDYGLAIISKYPLTETHFEKLSLAADAKAEPRILQMVTVNIPNQKPFVFANTHLDVLNTGNRPLQAKQIVAIANKHKLPFIIAGDWNATLNSTTLSIMDEAFTRTCSNCPVTCIEEGENGAIDFIAYTKSAPFKTKNYSVFSDNYASDHFPILAEIIITK
ncbi:endonuclease/exonuclease/phosphatase family protein [Pedobacter alpinus]|uniref:Endonuclease/exonuclease/phosphatase family protein n=1 Tax=Pedobacter alpinus TaxID=1590643 RepID=A0ABW5TUN8_9SPHI